MKTNQMRTSKVYLFRDDYSKGVSHYYLHLVETQRQAKEWESFPAQKWEGSVHPN